MIKTKFENVARQLNSDYQFKEVLVDGISGSFMPVSYHTLVVPFKGFKIIVNYELGNHNMATVNTLFTKINPSYIFEIKKNNHFKLLFHRNKSSLEVITESLKVKQAITKLLSSTGLESIASNSLFEPIIQFENNSGSVNLVTTFYLGFKGKENSIIPMVNFYKGLIQLIENDYSAK